MANPDRGESSRIPEEVLKNLEPRKPNPYGFGQMNIGENRQLTDPNTNVTTTWLRYSSGEFRRDIFPPNLSREIYIGFLYDPEKYPYEALAVRRSSEDISGRNQRTVSLKYYIKISHADPDHPTWKFVRPYIDRVYATRDTREGLRYSLGVRYSDIGNTTEIEFESLGKMQIHDRVFNFNDEIEINKARSYVIGRGSAVNLREVLGLLRLRGVAALEMDTNLDGISYMEEVGLKNDKEYTAYIRVQSARQRAVEEAAENNSYTTGEWSDQMIEDIIVDVKERVRRYVFPFLMDADVDYSVSEIEAACEQIALEAAPRYARFIDEAEGDEAEEERLFKQTADEMIGDIIFEHYTKLHLAGNVKAKFNFPYDAKQGRYSEDTLEVEFYDLETNEAKHRVGIKTGKKYSYDGKDYLLTYEEDNLVLTVGDSLRPTKGVRITFPGRNVDIKAVILAAQTTENSGWEKALDHFPVEFTINLGI